jgi:ABC-type branched-subunit amino acid transport system ATPase component
VGQEALRAGQTSGLDEVLDLFPVLAEMRGRLAGALSGGQLLEIRRIRDQTAVVMLLAEQFLLRREACI